MRVKLKRVPNKLKITLTTHEIDRYISEVGLLEALNFNVKDSVIQKLCAELKLFT